MAKEFTLKGIIKFLDQGASAAIKKVDTEVAKLGKNTQKISGGFNNFNQGLLVAGGAGAAVGGGFAMAIKQAAGFEQAMANLNAVNELSDEQMSRLTNTALKLGAETVFSSTEAANAMTELTKAGLTVDQTISAIPGVLSAAAAEGMGLANAAEIVVGILQGQNLQMDQATRVSDVLARTANSTAAGITDLGEAFRYANTLSAQGLMTFEDTAAALGVLSNAGLKGSIAGTSLVAMFNQITKPSKDVAAAFGGQAEMIKTFTDTATGKLKTLPEIMGIISQAADAQGNDFMRMAFLTDFVGVEGAKAFSALNRAVTQKDAQGRPMFQGLRQDIENASGSADEMAKKRLNSLQGALVVIGSAIQNIGIFIGNMFLPHLRAASEAVKTFAGDMANAFMFISQSQEGQDEMAKGMSENAKMMVQFAKGFQEGITEAIGTIKGVIEEVALAFKAFLPPGEDGLKLAGKWIAKAAVFAAVMAPIALGFVALSFGIGSVISGFGGLLSIGSGTFGMLRHLTGLIWAADKALLTLAKGFLMRVPIISKGVGMIGSAFTMLGTIIKTQAIAAVGLLKGAFIKLGAVMMANPVSLVIVGIAALVAAGWLLWKNWDAVTGFLKGAWEGVIGTFQFFVNWIKTAGIGEMIIKTILLPIRLVLEPIMQLMRFLASTDIAKKFMGPEVAAMVGGMASSMALFGDTTPITQQNSVAPQDAAKDVMAEKVEAKRLSMPPSAQPNVNVTVPTPMVELTNETTTILDGQVIDKSLSKRKLDRTERAGMNATNPKNRQLATQGGFADGFRR